METVVFYTTALKLHIIVMYVKISKLLLTGEKKKSKVYAMSK